MPDCVSSIFPLALVPSKILCPSKFRSCVECGKVWVSISANHAESASLLPQVVGVWCPGKVCVHWQVGLTSERAVCKLLTLQRANYPNNLLWWLAVFVCCNGL